MHGLAWALLLQRFLSLGKGNLPDLFDIPYRCRASGVLWMQKLRSLPLSIQSYQRLSLLKLGVGQNIVLHALSTARNFFFSNFYIPGPFTLIFFSLSLQILFLAFPRVSCG